MNKSKIYIVILSLISFAFLFPYLFVVLSSFKTRLDTFAYPPIWFFTPTLENFISIHEDLNIFFFMKNSVIISIVSTFKTFMISIPATYALARINFKRKELVAYLFLILQMIPGISIVFALFYIANYTGLYDTHFFLILAYLLWNVPYAIWLLRGFILAVPRELEEAALLDGCSKSIILSYYLTSYIRRFSCFWNLIFIGVCNEFSLAFFLKSLETRTLPTTIGFFMTHSGIKWGPMFATATLSTLPIVFIGLLVKKHFVQAMSFGAVKG